MLGAVGWGRDGRKRGERGKEAGVRRRVLCCDL
jgi:hypothetical protein